MAKKQEPLKVIIRNADGTICEDISKKNGHQNEDR